MTRPVLERPVRRRRLVSDELGLHLVLLPESCRGVRQRATRGWDSGQMSILLIGMVAITLTVVLGVVGVTSVQLSRIQLLDAADAAALDASDALAEAEVYAAGLGSGPPLSDATVVEAAAAHLDGRRMPSRVSSWAVGSGTGTPDGRTAVVTITGQADVPVVSPVLGVFGGGVSITVTSTARSDVDP